MNATHWHVIERTHRGYRNVTAGYATHEEAQRTRRMLVQTANLARPLYSVGRPPVLLGVKSCACDQSIAAPTAQ